MTKKKDSNKDKEKSMMPEPTPELIKQCKEKIERATSMAVKHLFDDEHQGGDFWAHILMQMDRIYDDPRIPTAAVSISNKLNLYINSYFFIHGLEYDLNMNDENDRRKALARRAAVIKHELCHVLFHHLTRGRDFGNQQLSNVAADLVCNSTIQKDLLNCGIFPQDYSLPLDKSMDFYYSNFPVDTTPLCQYPHEHDKQHQQGQGNQGQQGQCPDCGGTGQQGDQGDQDGENGQEGDQGKGKGKGDQCNGNCNGNGQPCPTCQGTGKQQGQGNGQGNQSKQAPQPAIDNHGNCKVCGGKRTFDNHAIWASDGGEHMSDQMKESLVNDAINRAADATKNAGNLPMSIQEVIALARKKPQIPWQTLLRQFVSRLSNGTLTHVKKRISKRFKMRPGPKIKPKLKLAVIVDVSGSISDKEYEIFLNEIFAIAKHSGEIDVIEWDTAVQGVYKIKGYKPNITRHGSGGTDPREAIIYVNNRKHKYDGVISFTDGYLFGALEEKFRLPSLWVITQNGTRDCLKKQRVIQLPKEESKAAFLDQLLTK